MNYLHSMIRVSNLEETLKLFCGVLGFREVRRHESEKGRFTLVFLSASGDEYHSDKKSPVLELTYNWPDENGKSEIYTGGRNFGHLAYAVENIYEVCQKLIDFGVRINRPPRDGYMAFFRTADGISVELLQKGQPLEIKSPWTEMENFGSW